MLVPIGKIAISKKVLCTSQDFTNITEINGNTTFYAYLLKYKMEQLTQNTQGTSSKSTTTSIINKIEFSTNRTNRTNKDCRFPFSI